MQRCLHLAKRGAGFVAPNPLVGAVLVFDDRIIGEGWHKQYGGPHAEVNAIHQAVQSGQIDLSQSTLYVSLEPCAHFGKTPPCTDLIIQYKIPKVVIGCRDPFKEVNGKGIEKLIAAGVEVEVGIMENECKNINKRFFTFHIEQRPYIILKWAQTTDGKMARLHPTKKASPELHSQPSLGSVASAGGALESSKSKMFFQNSESRIPLTGGGGARLLISNEYSNRLVHQWRSEEAAILIGTNTALMDNPELTTRLWPGPSPIRLVVDMNLRLPTTLNLFDRKVKTIVFNIVKDEKSENLVYFKLNKEQDFIPQLLNALYELKIQSVLVEGGAKLLQSFIDGGTWDEMRIISNSSLEVQGGLASPVFENIIMVEEQQLLTDKVEIYKPKTLAGHSDQ
jgi:diaminohydroxyphosphoribosylaminopyrimidine deaminase/5-amino-6-(5-phosphoribosylamino)uracil reductase